MHSPAEGYDIVKWYGDDGPNGLFFCLTFFVQIILQRKRFHWRSTYNNKIKLDSNCICNWTSSQHYSNGRVTLTFDLWTPKNYTLVSFPKYYHWSKYEVPRCYGSKVRVDRTKVGRNKNKKNNNNNQHENNTYST